MEFDRDRLAKLAGIRGDEAPTQGAQPVRTSESGIIREGRRAFSAGESDRLRRIPRRRSLTEGESVSSDSGTEPIKANSENIGEILKDLGIDVDPQIARQAAQTVLNALKDPDPEVQNAARDIADEAQGVAEKVQNVAGEINSNLHETEEAGYGLAAIMGILTPLGIEVANLMQITAAPGVNIIPNWHTAADMNKAALASIAVGALIALGTKGLEFLTKPKKSGPMGESADVSRLREIIRAETRSMIAEARAQRSAAESGDLQRIQGRRSLREAAAMGFYGPGFAGSPRPALGGPMSSSGRLAWLTEAEAAPADAGAEPIEINSGNIGEILKGLGIDADPQAVLKALENPTDEVKDVAREVKPEAREAAEEIKTGLQESAASGYARGVIWGVLAPLGVEALNAVGITGEKTSGDMHEAAAVFAAAGAIAALSTYGIVKLNKYFSKK